MTRSFTEHATTAIQTSDGSVSGASTFSADPGRLLVDIDEMRLALERVAAPLLAPRRP